MTKVSMSIKLPASAQTVWNMIGGFNDLAKWHPAVAKSEERTDRGTTLRKLSLHGGGSVVERLDVKNDKSRTCSYAIVDSPLPVTGYRAVLRVVEGDDGGCTVEWSSEFQAAGAPESEIVKLVRGIYDTGFQSLHRMFGDK